MPLKPQLPVCFGTPAPGTASMPRGPRLAFQGAGRLARAGSECFHQHHAELRLAGARLHRRADRGPSRHVQGLPVPNPEDSEGSEPFQVAAMPGRIPARRSGACPASLATAHHWDRCAGSARASDAHRQCVSQGTGALPAFARGSGRRHGFRAHAGMRRRRKRIAVATLGCPQLAATGRPSRARTEGYRTPVMQAPRAIGRPRKSARRVTRLTLAESTGSAHLRMRTQLSRSNGSPVRAGKRPCAARLLPIPDDLYGRRSSLSLRARAACPGRARALGETDTERSGIGLP